MKEWLAGVVAIVVFGVIIELISKDTPLWRFIRGIYGFFVLFMIVRPLPQFFNDLKRYDFLNNEIVVNGELLLTTKKMQIERALQTMGYEDCIVVCLDGEIYINSGQEIEEEDKKTIIKQFGGNINFLF
ncbi:MAG: hypothetical protein LBH47_00405 [Christensenellaceae bacterium]|jgi:hypothetical protein|nr:hypothetical protein [Christensenellaceae bacterium]